MAFGKYNGSVSEISDLVAVATELAEATTASQVLGVIDNRGPKLGYAPVCYLARLVHRGTAPAEAAQIVKDGWTSRPFGKTDSSKQVSPTPPTDPQADYYASLIG